MGFKGLTLADGAAPEADFGKPVRAKLDLGLTHPNVHLLLCLRESTSGRSLVVKFQPSKLAMRVRFPPPAPIFKGFPATETPLFIAYFAGMPISGLFRQPCESDGNKAR